MTKSDDALALSNIIHSASRIDMPSSGVVCHVAFFDPIASRTGDVSASVKERKQAIAENFMALYRAMVLNKDAITWPLGRQTPSVFDRVVNLTFDWNSLRASMHFELHDEYGSLLVYLYAPNTGNLNSFANEFVGNFSILDAIIERRGENRSENCFKYLYNDIWSAFINDIFGVISLTKLVFKGFSPTQFVNVRGVIHSGGITNASDRHGDDKKPPRDHKGSYAARMADYVWPFIASEPRTKPLARSDVAACGMAHGHVLYMSALGAHSNVLSLEPGDDNSPPVRYIVCSTQTKLSDRVVTVLIDNLHSAVILRHAAIEKYEEIRGAKIKCQAIIEKMRHIWNLIEGDVAKESENIKSGLIDVRASITALDGEFINGIMDRIERSQRYTEQFYDIIKQLEISRIHQFEPYDRFVDHLIGGKFKQIAKIGERLREIESEYTALMRSYMSFVSARSLGEIVAGNAQMHGLQEASSKLLNTITVLQSRAELVVSGALIPYYLGNGLSETLEALFQVNKHTPVGAQIEIVVWVFSWVVGLSLFIEGLAKNFPDTRWGAVAEWLVNIVRKAINMVMMFLRIFQHSNVVWALVTCLIAGAWVVAVVYFDLPERFR